MEHVAIASLDPRKLAAWYAAILGFTINYNSGRTVFVKAPNGSMIENIRVGRVLLAQAVPSFAGGAASVWRMWLMCTFRVSKFMNRERALLVIGVVRGVDCRLVSRRFLFPPIDCVRRVVRLA